MTTFISNNILPIATGIHFLYSNRMSRSYAAGAKEQRFLCANNWIERSELFVFHAKNNVEALCSESFASRFSYLSYGSYAAVAALYYFSKSLEDTENSRLKTAVDFVFAHVPDIILVASVVQAAVGLYFGINLVQNSIHLTFYLWSFLEQGMYWDRPIENSGPLFQYNEGKIVRSYDSILGTINNWIHLPISFACGGTVAKVGALIVGFALLPDSVQSRLIPTFIKERVNTKIENKTKDIDFEIASTPEKVKRVWVYTTDHFQVTQKHFEPFEIQDYFPKESLENLEKKLQRYLKHDTKLSDPDRKELTRLLGSEETHGLLYNHAMGANDESELGDSLILMKNIFGALNQNWDKRKTVLLFHKGDFLCKTAIADTIKSLCLELIPEISQIEKGLSEKDLEKNRVESGIKLVLQQLRDHVFTTHFQSILAANESKFLSSSISMKFKAYRLYNQVRKVENIFSRDYWINLYNYGKVRLNLPLLNLVHHCQQASATSRHQITANRVMFGKLLGLSGYQEAKRDTDLMDAAAGIPPSLNEKTAKLTTKIVHPYLKLRHLLTWKATLIDAIINLGDTRLSFSDVRNLILRIAEERDKDEYKQVYADALEIPHPGGHGTDTTTYDVYFEKGTLFLHRYLPLLLHELGYLEENKDIKVDHWYEIHDHVQQLLAAEEN
ncbi:hypothetical protein [Simkania sp.]|uniref:hypothetical protein n=1 Tax=Simkania sp. TaxID=34094 RepID=UPI003B51DFB4